jgi:diguanylate cyclase (GGDEF)-like protein
MAASDHHRTDPSSRARTLPADQRRALWRDCLQEQALLARLEEEICRASRVGTPVSCMVVQIDDLSEIAARHGDELLERTLSYACGALSADLRRFDRVGLLGAGALLVLLPGADGERGAIVARRALSRLRAIKIEVGSERVALRISVGVAAWHGGQSAEQLIALAKSAAPDERLGFRDALRI